jgi:hypothetical protein
LPEQAASEQPSGNRAGLTISLSLVHQLPLKRAAWENGSSVVKKLLVLLLVVLLLGVAFADSGSTSNPDTGVGGNAITTPIPLTPGC